MLEQYIGAYSMASWPFLFSVVLIYNTFSFFFCYFLYNDISVTHISWGLLFMIPNFTIIGEQAFYAEDPKLSQIQGLALFLNTMWALRLIAHLASRYNGVEDKRFTKVVRERWSGWSPVG